MQQSTACLHFARRTTSLCVGGRAARRRCLPGLHRGGGGRQAGATVLSCLVFCSVLQPSSIRGLATPWAYFLHLSLSSVILTDSSTGSPVRLRPSRTKTRQNESPAERNPDRTKSHQNDNPSERKPNRNAQFEPVYNRLCVETVFAASVNVTTETY